MQVNKWTDHWAKTREIESEYLEEVVSTNDRAKDAVSISQSSKVYLFLSDHQTSGRGRNDNKWVDNGSASKPGGILLSSWSFHLESPPQPIMPALVGLALYKAAKETWPTLAFGLKAPNDLYLKNKKVGGLLLEAIQQGSNNRLIVGLGLNVTYHPDINNSGAVIDFLKAEEISQDEWTIFLENLFWRLKEAMQDGVLLLLTQKLCDELLCALNDFEGLTEKYLSVSKNCSLQKKSGSIPWQDL